MRFLKIFNFSILHLSLIFNLKYFIEYIFQEWKVIEITLSHEFINLQ